MSPLLLILSTDTSRIVTIVLKSLHDILKVGEDESGGRAASDNKMAKRVIEAGGLKKIVMLLQHEDDEISLRATTILQSHFAASIGVSPLSFSLFLS